MTNMSSRLSRDSLKLTWRKDLVEDLRRQRIMMTDVNIICSDGSVPSHKLFLASLSNHLRDLLRDSDEEQSVILLPGISSHIMTTFLSSVFNGSLPQKEKDVEDVRDVARLLGCDYNLGFDITSKMSEERRKDPSPSKLCQVERLERSTTNLETPCALCSEPVHTHRVSVTVKQERNGGYHQKLLYVCCTCGHVASTPSRFLAHTKSEKLKYCGSSQPKLWKFDCPLCPKQINKHQRSESSFNCCHCEESFSTPKLLTHHLLTVKNSSMTCSNLKSEEQPLVSDIKFEPCGDCMLYKTKKEKMVHYKEIHPDHYRNLLKKNLESWMTAPSSRYIECDICNLSIRKCNLKTHKLNIHRVNLDNQSVPMNESPSDRTCDICGHVSAYAKDLKKHKKSVHAKVFSFSCKFCNKKFSNKGNLNQHEVAHTGVTPYQCHQCGNQFRRRAQLTKHIESHSQGTCLMPEPPGDPASQLPTCVPGAVVSGQPSHQMPLIMTHLDSGTLRHQAGIFKDLAVTQAPALKMPAFIIHS